MISVIIGGGINGVAIAADAAGRGLSILLCEQDDLANGTSSASSKLIHGGLRYLEQYDFALVKESLRERTLLHKSAPSLVRPLPFIIPCRPKNRSKWLIRLGLFLYDRLTRHSPLAKSKTITFNPKDENNPLKEFLTKGFVYTDCQTDDARLVILNALRAQEKGAHIYPRTKCVEAFRHKGSWQITLKNNMTQKIVQTRAKVLINATGPWLTKTLQESLNLKPTKPLKLVKGSHIVLPKLYAHDKAYLLQHEDKRVVFVMPYQHQYTLIGTTDEDFIGNPKDVKIDAHEINYLCDIVNQYFKKEISPQDIISSWSGVRPLIEETAKSNAAVNRRFYIELQNPGNNLAPLINIYGGKLTTHRLLAEKVMNKIAFFFPHAGPTWTANSLLPGNDLKEPSLATLFPWLPKPLAQRYQEQYASLARHFLNGTSSLLSLGQDLGHGLYEKEVEYLIEKEWACTAEDILWRRTKLGLVFTPNETADLKQWVASRLTI